MAKKQYMMERMDINYILNIGKTFDKRDTGLVSPISLDEQTSDTPCEESLSRPVDIDLPKRLKSDAIQANSHNNNSAYAMRLLEVVNDFRSMQHKMINCLAESSLDNIAYEEISIAHRCQAAANHLLYLVNIAESGGNCESPSAELEK